MSPPPFIRAPEVAGLIGLPDGPAFLRRRRDLEDRAGFPLPMPFRVPLIWRRDQVESWLQAQGRPRGLTPELPANVIRLAEKARAG
jgi:hypothetical protein